MAADRVDDLEADLEAERARPTTSPDSSGGELAKHDVGHYSSD